MSILSSVTSSLFLKRDDFDGENILVPGPLYPKNYLYEVVKRGIDIFGALIVLAMVSPLMVFVGIGVRLTSKGNIIFTQKRLTKDGRAFDMYKFRTMVADAEKNGPAYAQSADPRVTAFGRFLRISRLDELPQLINVLIGDMSLIGPRPERPEMALDLAEALPSFHRRLEVKAGLTGFAQIEGGYASDVESYRRKLALDLLYIKNRSLLLDVKIVFKTVLVILTGFGAR